MQITFVLIELLFLNNIGVVICMERNRIVKISIFNNQKYYEL